MLNLAGDRYSEDQVKKVLHYKNDRHISFRYELLDGNDIFKDHLKNVQPGGGISVDAANAIKRTGNFTFRYDGQINWQTDKIKPYFVLHMPDGGVHEWPLGVFYMLTPVKSRNTRRIWYEVEAYDKTVMLEKDSDSTRTFFAAGVKYTDAVSSLLVSAGIATAIITPSAYTLMADREWEIGTSKLEIISTLLHEINYNDIYVDANGYFIVAPYVSPSSRVADYVYAADQYSVIVDDQTSVQMDSFDAPNVVIGLVSNPDVDEMVYTYENMDSTSPISIPARNGRRVVEKIQFEGIASQDELQVATEKRAAEAAEIYETVRFNTALMPHHDVNDLIVFESATASGRYMEEAWNLTLQAGAQMTHSVRRLTVL